MGQREAKETQQLDGLVRVYSAMKPQDAARIFATLDGDVRINVAGRLKADAMAGILAALPADVAQRLTVELATRYKGPPSTHARHIARASTAAACATSCTAGSADALRLTRDAKPHPSHSFASQFVIAMAALPPLAFGQPARDSVAVDTKAGYARILFTFKEPTPVEASIADGVLTIELARRVETSMEAMRESLGPLCERRRGAAMTD